MRFARYIALISLLALSVLFGCEEGEQESPAVPYIPVPIASFTEIGEQVTPATIIFHNTSQNADEYLWRFGDGDSTTITDPTHTYTVYGDYPVTLVATNWASNKSDSLIRTLSIAPRHVYITAIRVDNMPFTDINGAGWDSLDGPDVYVNFTTWAIIIFTVLPHYYPDVAPSDLPIQWTFAEHPQIPSWSTTYYIELWDYDGTGNDFIGYSNGFRIYDVIAASGYVSSVQRQNTARTITTTVFLEWE